MTIEPIESGSEDLVTQNIAALKALFPEAFTEGKIDFDVLKQLLGGTVDEREEKYGLNWHGKRRARQLALTPSTGTLLPCPEDSVDWDTTQNLMIEGDNLEVLKLLQKSYAGKVKLIYIDPPYNTGKDFVYPDDFRDNIKNYLELTGQTEGGRQVGSNTEASGRFHTDWLNMIYPRLKLAKTLLEANGIICVNVDDTELSSASKVLNELFGEENFLGRIVRATGTTTGQDSGGLGKSFDYILVFGRDPDTALSGIPLDEDDEQRFQGQDDRGKYSTLQLRKTGNADRREDRPSMFYPISSPDGISVLPIGPGGYESRWRFGPERYQESLDNDLIVWKQVARNGTLSWTPYVKYYLEGRTKRPSPLWDDIDGNKKATIEIRELFGDKAFNNPKPIQLISRLIQLSFGEQKQGIVLDFFAGSGTTGHAVLNYNNLFRANLQFILVQLPEPFDENSAEQKIATQIIDTIGKPRNIAELTKERLRRGGTKIKSENPLFQGDTGFRVFKLASSNIQAWNTDAAHLESSLLKNAEHLVQGRTEQDVLYELLLKLGLDLCTPLETKTIAAKTVYLVGKGRLIACLDNKIDHGAVAPLAQGLIDWHSSLGTPKDATIIFRDSAFVDDVTKTNLAETLKQAGLTNLRSL